VPSVVPPADPAALDLDGIELERASTAEQVAATVRQYLLDGKAAPKTKLSDQVLAATLGVSRNTVREAFAILAAEGLLQRNLHKGAVVAELSFEQLADVYQARRAIELSALNFAAKAQDDWLADVQAALGEMSAAAAIDDTKALLDADRRFHEAIIAPIGSQRISDFYRLIQTQIRLTRAWNGARMAPTAFVARHAEIVEALVHGDFTRGGGLLEQLIDDGQLRVQEQLRASHGA